MKTKQREAWMLIEDADWVRRMAELENNDSVSVGGFLNFLPPDEAEQIIENIQKKRRSASPNSETKCPVQ